MAFKFIVKDEDLPKPTILARIHIASIISGLFMFGVAEKLPLFFPITFGISELIQIIYSAIFYKKIVWERYSDIRLRSVTISFISTNIYLAILSFLVYILEIVISLQFMLITLIILFFLTLLSTIYISKSGLARKLKASPISLKNFSFPFYKFTAIIPMFFIIPNIFIKSKAYMAISIALLALGFGYTALGEYYFTKRKDELERLIKYEASFVVMQFLPALIIPLFFLEVFFKVQIPWFYCLMGFSIVHLLVQAMINKKYE